MLRVDCVGSVRYGGGHGAMSNPGLIGGGCDRVVRVACVDGVRNIGAVIGGDGTGCAGGVAATGDDTGVGGKLDATTRSI